ncbi:hypothetical protein N7493_006472 [Penicillium malachiteum]|uniref:Uncharacterized protein n=1 Tax=Penicillium malachiteum TaxID=1324776 RepID=A0AAD6MVJ5_9EURO|nr:hypothetical protein N7493_006472 [Penicillium malachiteum]
MSLHGLGVIGAQVAASIKSSDEKSLCTPKIQSPPTSLQSTPVLEHCHSRDFDPSVGAKPYSPFYPHSTPTLSYEHLTFETKAANRNHSQLRDLENAGPYTFRNESPRRSKLWEGENPPRSCMSSLSGRQRMILKAIIAIVTVGSMIAIALGITAAVGGAAWRANAEKTALGG